MTQSTDFAVDLPGIARALLDERRARDTRLGDGIFADPAWDLMLAVYLGERDGRPLSAASLEAASPVPQSTVRRWVRLLVERGILIPSGERDVTVTLGAPALARLEDHLTMFAGGLPMRTRADGI
ncbi:hypothetical protein [Sphingomonas sanxanigenens]|uniref:HTH marR-type domain-containing protein n=1 Tax=Sphingomonas sanxanigenens DSM 19645 = NX02 TaxID=1123269 RepID=W0AA26_9SPHN|nr:hypothetical protein [Sphingomonas sanxanigenens]AHE53173.1 hypothetical protein NX02_07230 [Sphingomonas sanxanigenens DSM 19645 = NX02]